VGGKAFPSWCSDSARIPFSPFWHSHRWRCLRIGPFSALVFLVLLFCCAFLSGVFCWLFKPFHLRFRLLIFIFPLFVVCSDNHRLGAQPRASLFIPVLLSKPSVRAAGRRNGGEPPVFTCSAAPLCPLFLFRFFPLPLFFSELSLQTPLPSDLTFLCDGLFFFFFFFFLIPFPFLCPRASVRCIGVDLCKVPGAPFFHCPSFRAKPAFGHPRVMGCSLEFFGLSGRFPKALLFFFLFRSFFPACVFLFCISCLK